MYKPTVSPHSKSRSEPPKVLTDINVNYLSVNNGFEIVHKVVIPNQIMIVYIKKLK